MASITNHSYSSTMPIGGFKMIFNTETQILSHNLLESALRWLYLSSLAHSRSFLYSYKENEGKRKIFTKITQEVGGRYKAKIEGISQRFQSKRRDSGRLDVAGQVDVVLWPDDRRCVSLFGWGRALAFRKVLSFEVTTCSLFPQWHQIAITWGYDPFLGR